MWCPVHFSGGCSCRWARAPRLLVALALLVGCAAAPSGPCSLTDAQLIMHEAACLANVGAVCADVPADEPCPFEEDCKRYTRERCGAPKAGE
jgi:hypothetical protein